MGKSKGLKGLDVFLGMICLLFFLDTCSPMAAMGVTAITWAIILMLIFYIPSGLITAELGAAYPDDGGMYSWVKRAYGKRWGPGFLGCIGLITRFGLHLFHPFL